MKSLEGVPKRGDEGEKNKQLQERGRACTDDADCQGPRSGWSFHLKLTHTHTGTQTHRGTRTHALTPVLWRTGIRGGLGRTKCFLGAVVRGEILLLERPGLGWGKL